MCLSLFPIQKDHPLLLTSYTQRAGVLRSAGQDQAFLCHSFQQTLVGTGKVFALFLTEFADNLVAQFTVQIEKSIILIPKAGTETKLTGITFVIHICLVALQQSTDNIIYPVCKLCRDHERAGFVEGIKIGIRLAQEL